MAVRVLAMPVVVLLVLGGVGIVALFATFGRRGRVVMGVAVALLLAAVIGLAIVRAVFVRPVSTNPVAGVDIGPGYMTVRDGNSVVHIGPGNMYAADSDSVVRIGPGTMEVHDGNTVTRMGPGYLKVQPIEIEVAAPVPAPVTPVVTEALSSSAEPWKSAADLGFEADVYPSTRDAAEALVGVMIQQYLATRPEEAKNVRRVWIQHPPAGSSDGGQPVEYSVLQAMGDRIMRIRNWGLAIDGQMEEDPNATIRLQADLVGRPNVAYASWDPQLPTERGTLRIRMIAPGWTTGRTARYVEARWLADTSSFLSSHASRGWVVARSSSAAADVAGAHTEALADAARQVLPAMKAELAGVPGLSWDDHWLLARIQPIIQSRITDQFVQTFVRPYGGQVVRKALLVETPPLRAEVLRLCTQQAQQSHRDTQTRWSIFVSAGMLTVIVCALGMLVNSLTKGYYRGTLIFTGSLLVIVGVLVIVKMMANHMTWAV